MTTERPSTSEAYLDEHGAALQLPANNKFTLNVGLIEQAISQSCFVLELETRLQSLALSYSGNPSLMFAVPNPSPLLTTKNYASVLDKVFRENCVYNRHWPEPPKSGFINGKNLYGRINDLVRGRVTCRYLDGPALVTQSMTQLALDLGLRSEVRQMATDRGYYAWHFYVSVPCNVIIESEVENIDVMLEIQVTTQLAELLTHLTHDIYSLERSSPPQGKDASWKWDSSSVKFKAAYMGHTLHMLEGGILDIKNRAIGGGSKDED